MIAGLVASGFRAVLLGAGLWDGTGRGVLGVWGWGWVGIGPLLCLPRVDDNLPVVSGLLMSLAMMGSRMRGGGASKMWQNLGNWLDRRAFAILLGANVGAIGG